MNMFQYAIARHLAQLLKASEQQTLTQLEVERLEVLEHVVERYEAEGR